MTDEQLFLQDGAHRFFQSVQDSAKNQKNSGSPSVDLGLSFLEERHTPSRTASGESPDRHFADAGLQYPAAQDLSAAQTPHWQMAHRPQRQCDGFYKTQQVLDHSSKDEFQTG